MDLSVLPQSLPIFPRQFTATMTTAMTSTNVSLNINSNALIEADVLLAMEEMLESSLRNTTFANDRKDRQLWPFFGNSNQKPEVENRRRLNRKRKLGQQCHSRKHKGLKAKYDLNIRV